MTEALLIATDLRKRFGDREVLQGVSIELSAGEIVAIVGPSGSGKTTFLRSLNLLEVPDAGELVFRGKRLFRATRQRDFMPPAWELNMFRTRVGMVFQDFRLWPNKTVLQNIIEAPVFVLGRSRREASRMARDWLMRFGLINLVDAYPGTLSGGEQQRVAFARALALSPDILLMDEVTSALDVEAAAHILSLIQELADGQRAMVIVTHHLHFACRIAHRMLFMCDGRVLEHGSPRTLVEEPQHPRLQAFVKAALAT